MVDEDRHLELDLPADVPVGPVELTIRPLTTPDAVAHDLTREEARSRLQGADMLSRARYAPPDAANLSVGERERLGRLFAAEQSISALIDEDRVVH